MKKTAMDPREELIQFITTLTSDQLHKLLNDPEIRNMLEGKFDFSAIPSTK